MGWTIDDILREMREHDNIVLWKEYITYGYTGPYFKQDVFTTKLHDIAGRIERAARILKDENERLKSALQPVLDIVMDSATSDLSMELAIKEAKRIYNEGER